VVCREHYHQSKYSDYKPNPVPICSVSCPNQVVCKVCDAARATSAAPTFFPVQHIGGRFFVDGGMEHNNPSYAIFQHYTEYERSVGSRRASVVNEAASLPATRHGNLDFSRVRFVNLGTGTKPNTLPDRRRDRLATFLPPFIRMGVFLKRTLTEFATNSENVADQLKILSSVSGPSSSVDFKYKRFSADNGVCYIKMDSYKQLALIENLTRKYLEREDTQSNLRLLG
jgi:patatin-like phospholipase/acyl hydrolase